MAALSNSRRIQTATRFRKESPMTRHFPAGRGFLAVAALCLFPVPVFAQANGGPRMDHDTTLPPTPVGSTPMAPDGHPDLTGLWNGLADNLLGVPNPIGNV